MVVAVVAATLRVGVCAPSGEGAHTAAEADESVRAWQERSGGVHQRAAAMCAPVERPPSSALANEILEDWAWGHIFATKVQSLAARAEQDGLLHPDIVRDRTPRGLKHSGPLPRPGRCECFSIRALRDGSGPHYGPGRCESGRPIRGPRVVRTKAFWAPSGGAGDHANSALLSAPGAGCVCLCPGRCNSR